MNAEILNRTNHVVKTHEVRSPENCKDDGADECAHKAFDCLLRRKLDERRTSHSYTPDVSETVIADYKRRWHPEPDETFEDIVHDEVTRDT